MTETEKMKVVTPFYGVTTLDFFYEKVTEAFGLVNTSPEPKRKRVNKYEWASTFIVLMSQIALCLVRLRELQDVQYKNIKFGYAIRESTICLSNDARFRFGKTLVNVTLTAAKIYCYWKNEFKKKTVGMVIGGTESYIYFGVISQLAKQYHVPVISLRQRRAGVVAYPFDVNTLRSFPATYTEWPKLARALDLSEASRMLEERVAGDYQSLTYMTSNSVNDLQTPVSGSLQNAIWIYAHDFFDSPSVWGEGIFNDQVEWLDKTIAFLLDNEAKVIVKWHPNARQKCRRVYAEFEGKFNEHSIFLYDPISLNKVQEFSPLGVVTSMGSVIPEAAFIGIPVVAASPHPYTCVGLASPPTSISQYEKNLKSLITSPSQAPLKQMKDKAVMAMALMNSVYFRAAQSAELSFQNKSQTLRKFLASREGMQGHQHIPDEDTLIELLGMEFNSDFGRKEFETICKEISVLTGLDYRHPPLNEQY